MNKQTDIALIKRPQEFSFEKFLSNISIRELKGIPPKPKKVVTLKDMDDSIAESAAKTLKE